VTSSANHFERFHGHTLLKHEILKAYLSSWAYKLLQDLTTTRVYFIDAFAGPGKDGVGNPGSPLIAAKIACQVREHLAQKSRTAGRTMLLVAIEDTPKHFANLKAQLAAFKKVDVELCVPLKGTLSTHIDYVVGRARTFPILAFLDPFGLKGLDATTYPKLLHGERSELFVLLGDVGAARLHGVVTADAPNVQEQIAGITSTPFLFPEITEHKIQDAIRKANEHAKALDVTKPACREYLTASLGNTEWESELAGVDPSERPVRFLRLFIKSMLRAGARYVVTIPMRDEDGAPIYTLVHASKSSSGYVAMKEAVSTGLNKGTLPAPVVDRMREDLLVPPEHVVKQIDQQFRGRSAGWTDIVRPWVLANTAVFHFQVMQVREALARSGRIPLGKSGKPRMPITCDFR